MYIDEANIARNVYERTYVGLAFPLDYHQYAPPLFLWIIKTATKIFGYSEYAYRLFSLLCSALTLALFYSIAKQQVSAKAILYPLALFSFGPIYVQYAAACKQYIPDQAIALALLFLAINISPGKTAILKFILIWAIAGTFAIWGSMPSVFLLAGIGSYYFYDGVIKRNYPALKAIVGIGAIWLFQFVVYYVVILKPQANSAYLQSYHKEYFFYWPLTIELLKHDFELISLFISTIGGHQVIASVLNLVFIIIALRYLWVNNRGVLLLLGIPLFMVLLAACLRQYTLIPRVTLFAMPLLLLLIAIGVQQLLNKQLRFLNVVFIVCAIVCIVNYNAIKNFAVPMQREEMKSNLSLLAKNSLTGNNLYVHHLGYPAYAYYTQIHPDKDNWKKLAGGKNFEWGTNLDSLVSTFPKTAGILYGWDETDQVAMDKSLTNRGFHRVANYAVAGGSSYVYSK